MSSPKQSYFSSVSVADAALSSPVYYRLAHLSVSQCSSEQGLQRLPNVTGGAAMEYTPNGELQVHLVLEGTSDASAGEALLRTAILQGAQRLVRLTSVQGQQWNGTFFVTRFTQEARGGRFESIRAELRAHGPVSVS